MYIISCHLFCYQNNISDLYKNAIKLCYYNKSLHYIMQKWLNRLTIIRIASKQKRKDHQNLASLLVSKTRTNKFHICRQWTLFVFFCLMVLNATFNNISVISLRSVLLVEETGGPRENHRPIASHWQTLSHNVVHLVLIEIRTHKHQWW